MPPWTRGTAESTTVVVDEVASPQTIAEALAFMKRRPDCIPWAGGTLLSGQTGLRRSDRPVAILDLGRIAELRQTSRSERYMEFGACVTLSSILALPAHLQLEPLREAAGMIGTSTVRSLATLGGNVAARQSFLSCFAALSCMDAMLEIRNAAGTAWVSIQSIVGFDWAPAFPEASLLTRIRVPARSWDFTAVRRLGDASGGNRTGAVFAATARLDRGAIAEVRLVAAGMKMVRDRDLELSLPGKRFPLTGKALEAARDLAVTTALDRGFDAIQIGRAHV